MFTHYLKIAFRNMRKHKAQSVTGIFGLAFGLACFVPALYWLRYETSYDSFYPGAEHIYRVYAVEKQSGKVNEQVPGILARSLHEHFPATEAATGFFMETNNCSTERMPHIRLRMLNADSTFFRVFRQAFVSGDARQPLQTVHDIVLTESVAMRMFGDVETAIGQHVQSTFYFFNPPYTVTAVVKDPPANTGMPFDAILYSDMLAGTAASLEMYQWVQFNTQLYAKFHPLTDIDELAEQLRDFTSRLEANAGIELRILPVGDVRHRLNSGAPFTLNFIRLFAAAGILLLFTALFNFLNLQLDLSRQRLRELRQRTIHGATGGQLVRQMTFELACAILPAMALACLLVALARPAFSSLLDIEMDAAPLLRLFAVCGAGVTALLLLAGAVSFRRLSRMAMQRLSEIKTGRQPALRRMAVVLQLAVSVVFIVAALVVVMQIRFVDRKDLGFDRSSIIQLYGLPPYMKADLRAALIHELEAIPQIETVSTSNFEPQHSANTFEMVTQVEWPGKSPDEKPAFNVIPADSRFAETFGLKMLAGEWPGEGGTQKVVLNGEAVRAMGLDEPVGAIIRMSIDNVDIDSLKEAYEVVGVVNDFHTLSLRSRIHPTIFRQPLSGSRIAADNILYVHVTPGQEQEAIRRITAILPGIDPSFADLRLMPLGELYDSFNRSEQAGLKMFSVLATVCLLISLFGIYAVATAATRRRRKEIAIRKVLGAEIGGIIRMFFRDYALQVIAAGVVALPPVYIAMSRWLQGYAYRTNIPWWLLAGVIAGVVAVVLLTVLGQVLKAAGSNPAEVVKSE
jgi:putative ABC transport system permease protein